MFSLSCFDELFHSCGALHPYTHLDKESNSLLFQLAIKCPLKNPFISDGIEIAASEKKCVIVRLNWFPSKVTNVL